MLEVALVLVAVILAITGLTQVGGIVIPDVDPTFVFGNRTVLETQSYVPWIEVHLADGGSVVRVVVAQLVGHQEVASMQIYTTFFQRYSSKG